MKTCLLTVCNLSCNLRILTVWEIIKVSGHQYWRLAGGYDVEIGHF